MNFFRPLMLRLKAVFFKDSMDRDMAEQMQHHLDLMTEENVKSGMTSVDARNAALRKFGGIEQIKERARDERGWLALEQLGQDLRGAGRTLRKNPGFTILTVAIIALGIGATTAIFSIVYGVLLRPLPYLEPEQLVSIQDVYIPKSSRSGPSPGDYTEWKAQATSFSAIACDEYWPANITVGDQATRRGGRAVSAGYFATYGVKPFLGREFLPEEYEQAKENVVILNYKLWVELFNSDPGIIGRHMKVDYLTYTIVGVLPKTFMPEIMTDPGLFCPLVMTAQEQTDFRYHKLVTAIARLKPNVTLDQATTEMNVIANRLARQFPDSHKDWGVRLTPLIETKIGHIRPFLYLLLGAVGLLLFIACVNVANLLLARATSRQKELAVRTALGASRGRIVRQLMVESLVISLMGGLLGTVLAYASMGGLLAMAPMALPRFQEIAIDGYVLGFTLLLTLLTGVAFGILPALRASRINLSEVMKAGGRGGSEGVSGNRVRSLLVVFEISLALVLLSAAGLLMNSFLRLREVPLGFDMGTTKIAKIWMLPGRYPTADKQRQLVHQVLAQLGAVSGVHSVAFATAAPGWGIEYHPAAIAGRESIDPWRESPVSYNIVTPDYFRVMGIALVRGRLFNAHDTESSAPVVVVSDDYARKYFPSTEALGQRINVIADQSAAARWREIVGIVASVREDGPAVETPFQVYEPFDQAPRIATNLLIRSEGSVPGLAERLRAAMSMVDPDLPLPDSGPGLRQFFDSLIAPQRFSLFLFGVFASSALVLSAMGTYGVVAFSVAQRTREFGIRIAVGAQQKDVQRLVFARAGVMIGAGLLIGLGAAIATMQFLESLLFQVTARDPATLITVMIVLAGTALLACWIPARRATKVDPIIALRSE